LIYIRFFRYQCTLSLDTSGDDLYMRGYDKWTAEAPIRDNMAAGLLKLAFQGVEDLSEWEVVDPMMGSGTFLLEAHLMGHQVQRRFCFQNWEVYKSLKKQIEERTAELGAFTARPHVRGADKSKKNYETAKKNFATLKMNPGVLKNDDLFSDQRAPIAKKKRLAIVNPPYGKRLSIKEKDFFGKTFAAVADKYGADRVGLLVPWGAQPEHADYENVRRMPFSNNGIDVEFFLYLKKEKAP